MASQSSPSDSGEAVEDLAERLKAFVNRLTIRDVRFPRFGGRLLQAAPKVVVNVNVNRSTRYIIRADEFINNVRFRVELESAVGREELASSSEMPKETKASVGEDEDEDVSLQALARMDIEVQIEFFLDPGDKPGDEVIKAFLEQNTNFMVYPYFREAVQSLSGRLGLDKLVLGLWLFNEDQPRASIGVASPGGST